MKCKDCNDMTCKYRTVDAEKECVVVTVNINELSKGTDYIVDTTLRFENERLFVTRKPCTGGVQTGVPEMIDVTDEILDSFLKILEKRRETAYEGSVLSQLQNRY